MSDLSVTAASVRPMPYAICHPCVAGGSGNVGDVVYISSDGKAYQADASSEASSVGIGIVVSAGTLGETTFSPGDALSVCVFGRVGGFSELTPGQRVYVSDTPGRLSDVSGTVTKQMGMCWSPDQIFVFQVPAV